jgi:hypothetical protein
MNQMRAVLHAIDAGFAFAGTAQAAAGEDSVGGRFAFLKRKTQRETKLPSLDFFLLYSVVIYSKQRNK